MSIITDIKYEKLPVKNVNPAFAHLLPTKLTPEEVSFRLTNSNTAIANSLRRVFIEELPVRNLVINPGSIKSDDPFLDIDDLIQHLACIPISQTTPLTTKFALKVKNDTQMSMMIRSSEIKEVRDKSLVPQSSFNETHQLYILSAGKSLEINGITVEESNAYYEKNSHGLYSIAAGFRFRPDPVKIESIENVVPSQFSVINDPTTFNMAFRTNGTIALSKIIPMCCDNITARFSRLIENIDILLTNKGDRYVIEMADETDVVGQLLERYVLDVMDELSLHIGRISCVTPIETPVMRFTIILRNDINVAEDDIKKIIVTAASNIVNEMNGIRDQASH